MQVLAEGLEPYRDSHGLYPDNLKPLTKLETGALPYVPSDPWGGEYDYQVNADHSAYDGWTGPGVWHRGRRVKPEEPIQRESQPVATPERLRRKEAVCRARWPVTLRAIEQRARHPTIPRERRVN